MKGIFEEVAFEEILKGVRKEPVRGDLEKAEPECDIIALRPDRRFKN